jgi:hypothetical protein
LKLMEIAMRSDQPPMVKFRWSGPARGGGGVPAKLPHRPQHARNATELTLLQSNHAI